VADSIDLDAIPANELGDALSARELAKRYAPRLSEADNVPKDGIIDAAPSGWQPSAAGRVTAAVPGSALTAGGQVYGLRTPALRQRPRRGNSTSRAMAWAIVLVGVAGGFGAILTLELLMAPKAAPGATAVADLPEATATNDQHFGDRTDPSPAKTRRVALIATSGAEAISVDSGEKSLKPVGRAVPAAATGFIAPPAPTLNSSDLRGTSDGVTADTAVPERAPLRRGIEARPAANPALHLAAVDEPAAASAVAAGSDGTGSGEATPPPPRVPAPRPNPSGPFAAVALAYAPAADPVDRAAKAILAKAKYKPAAKGPKPGPGRIVSWANWVNLRASADNQSESVMMLSAGSTVTILKCASWCEIVADGKHGFVLKSLLSGTGTGTTPIAADRLGKRAGAAFSNPYLKVSNQ
jgi:hypothetical protein